jgi:hypothetical protein
MPRIVRIILVVAIALSALFALDQVQVVLFNVPTEVLRYGFAALFAVAALALWRGTPAGVTVARGAFSLGAMASLAVTVFFTIALIIGGSRVSPLIWVTLLAVPVVITSVLAVVVMKLGRNDVQSWALERSLFGAIDG